MNDNTFDEVRKSFRHKMIEKPLKELEAMVRTFEALNRMDNKQRALLIEDMKLMVSYKTRLDFEDMVKPMMVDWGANEKAS